MIGKRVLFNYSGGEYQGIILDKVLDCVDLGVNSSLRNLQVVSCYLIQSGNPQKKGAIVSVRCNSVIEVL